MSARRALVSATEAASRTSRRIIITPPAILRARVSRISTPTTASAAAAAALRFFTHTMSAPSRSPSPSPKQPQQPQPRFSAGTPAEAAEAALPSLLLTPGGGGGGRWRLTANGEGLEREFKFGTFAKTWVCLPFSSSPLRPSFPKDEGCNNIVCFHPSFSFKFQICPPTLHSSGPYCRIILYDFSFPYNNLPCRRNQK